jgi:hypothetical protein
MYCRTEVSGLLAIAAFYPDELFRRIGAVTKIPLRAPARLYAYP